MIRYNDPNLAARSFRNVYLVQNRNWWSACPYAYDREKDLVLTFDFGLLRQIRAEGGTAAFLDHLVDPEQMESYNAQTYRFLDSWYLDLEGRDFFSHRGLDFGNSLRLDFWNDVTYYVRVALNLLALRGLSFQGLYAGIEDAMVAIALLHLNMSCESWDGQVGEAKEYYFPCFRWMSENIRPQRFRQRLGAQLSRAIDLAIGIGERLGILRSGDLDVFVDRYFPTEEVVEHLKRDPRLNVVLASYTRKKGMLGERRLAVGKPSRRHEEMAARMLAGFRSSPKARWEIEGVDVGAPLHAIIASKIGAALPQALLIAERIHDFFEKRTLGLYVVTANIGLLNGMMVKYCAKNGVPVYFIINGLMLHKFHLEQIGEMTWINSYGPSIRKEFFLDAPNVLCNGDPRMDRYAGKESRKVIDRSEPTIVIGAGGFSNVDLNSYLASEFDFLHDVLQALTELVERGKRMQVVLKVRSNGYIEQYRSFVKEYFPGLKVELHDVTPFGAVVARADFYLSIYSGTLFEASLLGIPVLYYKKDTEILNPPYDGKSELVTAFSVDDLVRKLELFYQGDPVYESFTRREVMEKYIGPLDGGNVRRNVDFINGCIFDDH